MAIQFPTAGAIYAVDFEAASVQAICDAIKNALATCGWTTVALPSSFTVTFSGLPTNNQTATIGGLGYTFVTSLTQATPRQVKIGTTAAACATALMECINAGANSGTDYSNSTAAAGIFTAAVDATGLIVAHHRRRHGVCHQLRDHRYDGLDEHGLGRVYECRNRLGPGLQDGNADYATRPVGSRVAGGCERCLHPSTGWLSRRIVHVRGGYYS